MKNIFRIDKVLIVASVLLVLGFVIRLGADYYKYQNTINSTPFYVFIIGRSIVFLLPSIICFSAAKYVKKLNHIK
ncbi:hypothetical protein GCM10011351_00100 [Paraliobacillus quinghaiensis]|uniref:Uncharacterized protein n=1 Tax=Paraliobacillus quinghaiensis TaxID=470815 RepID=A0A917TDH9_9BACI|nr:hypothetical protein [Paraliobacillus quinghaiensis]GGM18306.1 hypothetical protein GCM10011351_00100 [Paraliobacillus quinghaiensis]